VIVLPDCSGPSPVVDAISRHFPEGPEVRTFADPPADSASFSDRIRGADSIVHFFGAGPLDSEALAVARPARVVIAGPLGASLNAPVAAEAGIAVYDTPGLAAPAVAEFTIALILTLVRGVATGAASLRAGGWRPAFGRELAGLRLGVIGLGRIGSRVARMASHLGCAAVAWSPSMTPEHAADSGAVALELDELLRTSDVISLHLRLSRSTEGLLDADRLNLLKPDALLVNTARAGLVDTKALRNAVAARSIGGAALDVFEIEPLSPDDPLRSDPSVLLTPHMAWMTAEAVDRFVGAAAAFVLRGDDNLVRRVA
jgi:phosphoglycerate dehydrogenase-like enzyme